MSAGSCRDDILALWGMHRKAELPDVPREAKGELWVLDEVVGGCVSFYLSAGGSLDPARVVVLEDCRADLARLMPALEDPAAAYFGRLGRLAGLLLGATKTAGEQGP